MTVINKALLQVAPSKGAIAVDQGTHFFAARAKAERYWVKRIRHLND